MTRGQESLTIDLADMHGAEGEGAAASLMPLADIVVLPAGAEELAEHEAVLTQLDKEAKGNCVWRAVMAAGN
jgi:DNA polymerase-3 subunit epsilon